MSMKLSAIFIFFLLICMIFLWVLTGKWIEDGLQPKADGTNAYAIIFGAKVNGDVPSLSLRYRLDAALAYANEYPHVTFVLSGGQGPDENISEAEAMKRFLTGNGIQEDRLILESASASTYENLLFSKELLPASLQSVTIITSDYHLARTKKLASGLDLQVDVVAANTPRVVEKKLRIRERLALIKTFIVGK